MDGEPLGVAVVGSGLFAQQHFDAFAGLPQARVAAVVDLDADRARAAAARAGGVAWSVSLAEILERPDVQAVDVCTPNWTHADTALQALRAGRHVLTEKPMALSLDEADRLDAAARENDVCLAVGLVMRHFPMFRAMRASLERGEIGSPQLVDLSHQAAMFWPGAWQAWQQDPARSGGHVVHNGAHLVDLAGWFLQAEPVSVYGHGYRTHSAASDIDDHWSLSITYDTGAVAHCEYSYSQLGTGSSVLEATVVGAEGALSYTSSDGPVVSSDVATTQPFDMRGDSMQRQLSQFVAAARAGRSPIPFRTLRADLAVCLAGQRSIDTGQVVSVESPGARS